MEVPPQLLTDILAAGEADAPAVVDASGVTSRAELRQRSARTGAALRALGLRGGDRVLIVLPNSVSFPTAALGTWEAGCVAVPLDYRIPAEQVVRIARDCQAAAIIGDGVALARLEGRLREIPSLRLVVVEARRAGGERLHLPVLPLEEAARFPGALLELERRPGDLAGLMYTSGSTGRPKGVMHSHETLLSSLLFTREHLGLTGSERVLVGFPLYHLFSLRVLLTHLMVGAPVLLALDLLAGLRRVAESGATSLLLVPAACALVLERFPSLLAGVSRQIRRVSVGSAALRPDLLAQLQALLPEARIDIPYGMTEARIGFLEPVDGRPERRLVAVDPNLELDVLDERGRPVTAGVGEVVLRGRGLMLGYWHNRDEENAALRREGFRTRDLMEVIPGGDRFLVGRKDDVINVGGEKVFPAEVESALLAHPRVRDARVYGDRDPRGVLGEVVRAAVVLDLGTAFDPEELLAHCRRRLEPYKVPSVLEPVAEIPRDAMGKVKRFGARA
jgi:long-chain acyl-CoA synthetase